MMNATGEARTSWLGAAALAVLLSACGAGEATGSGITGVALTDGPVEGTVSLTDSSAQVQLREVATRADGSFAIDVTGLTPPYMLRVEGLDQAGAAKLYAVSEGNENLDVNPITDLAFRSVSVGEDEDRVFRSSGSEEKRDAATRVRALLARLASALQPLFDRYGIADPRLDKEAVRRLLEDVRVSQDDGRVTVTNRATGAVIFQGRLDDLASGTFYPDAMPAGPGGGGTPGTCTSFTYSAWGTCTNGTQTRAVLTSSPSGCSGGAPVTTQACTTTPPAVDGLALYNQYCAGCHGNGMLGSSASSIQNAIDTNRGGMGTAALRALTPAQVAAIAAAGSSTPATCTSFTYAAWGTCQASGTQTRTVLTSSPSGCTGGAPVTTQACTYVPPATTCTSFTYSAWGACQPDNTQTRTVRSSSPTGCSGGAPVTTQACTYVPPATTCTSFTYSAWGACTNNTQTRTVLTRAPSGCTGGAPVTTQACTSTPPAIDGLALYNQYCAGCHGAGMRGSSASSIQNAINSNRGGMGTAALRALTPAQIAAIAATTP